MADEGRWLVLVLNILSWACIAFWVAITTMSLGTIFIM